MGIYELQNCRTTNSQIMWNSDLILNIGAKLTDSATARFSYQFNIDDVVMLNHHILNFKPRYK